MEVRSIHDEFHGWIIQVDRKVERTIGHWEDLEELSEILPASVKWL